MPQYVLHGFVLTPPFHTLSGGNPSKMAERSIPEPIRNLFHQGIGMAKRERQTQHHDTGGQRVYRGQSFIELGQLLSCMPQGIDIFRVLICQAGCASMST